LLPFGLNGVAAAVSLGAVGMAAYSIGRVPVVLSVSTRRLLSEIWPPTAAAVVAAAALFPLEQFAIDADGHSIGVGFLLVGVEGALGVAIYGSALRVLSPSQAAELLNAVKRAVALPYLRLRPRQPQAPGPQPPAL
jgi:hypothetical protein